MKQLKFVLAVNLDQRPFLDQHDVASLLRQTADRLNKHISANWGPYALAGTIKTHDGVEVGSWEVKGPHDDRDE